MSQILMKKRCMVAVDLQNAHGMTTGTKKWIKAKRESDGIAPAVEGAKNLTFIGIDGIAKVGHLGMLFGINPVVTDHFEMFVGNMADEALDESHGRKGFVNQEVIFMAVVMKGDRLTIIGVDA